jgi:8-oxo-dGTP pyrophosphatase MutT (NUDIX family)
MLDAKFMPKEFQKFVVSQKGMIMRDGQCLIFRLAKYDDVNNPDVWDLPGGRIDVGEEGDIAFKREIEEETGLKNFTDLGLADYFVRYPANKEVSPFCGFIHLLEIGDQEIKLSFEHCDMKWINEDEIDNYVYCWKKMPEMIKKGFELYKKLK